MCGVLILFKSHCARERCVIKFYQVQWKRKKLKILQKKIVTKVAQWRKYETSFHGSKTANEISGSPSGGFWLLQFWIF